MKNNSKKILTKKSNPVNENYVDLDDELPSEIDFSKLKQVDNPLRKSVSINLDSDLAAHFKNSRQLNQFLRLQLKSLAIIR
jgi:hypothetical protein